MAQQAQPSEKQPEIIHRFIGVWSLQSFTAHVPGGGIIHPFGESPAGQIRYDRENRVAVQIMRRNRSRFASGNPTAGTPEELAAAFSGYIGYYGRFRVDENSDTVVHILEACSFPNWVGSAQVRHYSFAGDDILTLRTPPLLVGSTGGTPVENTLVWRRER